MVCVGIDVAKDKHDCCILDSDGMVRADCFTIPNNMDGFKQLLQTIRNCTKKSDKIKVGLEATGHYSYNILGFLLDNDLAVYVMNPLHTNLYRKSLSLRKTKTDRVDARTIATMLLSDVDLKSYTDTAYHNEELKSLTRYRFDKVRERAKLKQSVSRLVTILFPELEKLVPSLHIASAALSASSITASPCRWKCLRVASSPTRTAAISPCSTSGWQRMHTMSPLHIVGDILSPWQVRAKSACHAAGTPI